MKQQQKGSISSSQKDSKQQKDSMSIYGKFNFKDSMARNMLSWSKIDHCLADETAEGLNMESYGKFKLKDSLIRNILDHCLAEKKN